MFTVLSRHFLVVFFSFFFFFNILCTSVVMCELISHRNISAISTDIQGYYLRLHTCNTCLQLIFKAPGSNSNQHQLVQVSSNEFNCQIRTDGYYQSPTSCSMYYICAAGMGFKTDCHPGLLFNPATLYCDFPDHVTCGANNNPAAPVVRTKTCSI